MHDPGAAPRPFLDPRLWGAVLAALVLFAPVLGAHWLETWDDSLIILGRPELHDLSLASLRKILLPGGFEEYAPLRDLSHLAEAFLALPQPLTAHLVNLLLYALCTASVYGLARSFGASPAAAGWAALLFAVHPVHVEAVAPASGRKDLLCLAFGIASFLAWSSARAAGKGVPCRRALALVLFTAGLLSKPSLVPLPLVVALAAALPLLRPPSTTGGSGSGRARGRAAMLRGLREAAPFLAVAVAFLPIIVRVRAIWGIESPYLDLTLGHRLVLVPRIVCTYLRILVWPGPMQVGYGMPLPTVRDPWLWISAAVAGAAAVAAILHGRRDRTAALGWLWFGAMCLPVVSLVPQSIFAADRYLLIPSAGAAVVAGQMAQGLVLRARGMTRAAVAASFLLPAVATGLLASVTARRIPHWRDDTPFWGAQIETSPTHWQPWLGLGYALEAEGRIDEALAALRKAAALFDVVPSVRLAGGQARRAGMEAQIGRLEKRLGRLEEAAAAYRRAIEILPTDRAEERARLAFAVADALEKAGRSEEAAAAYEGIERDETVPTPLRDLAKKKREPLQGGG